MEQPDIHVSVDLGTTFTGVAWTTPRTPIQVINDWPGSGDRGERKVPTTLVYNADGTLASWGFMCEDQNEGPSAANAGQTRREFFKIFLDEETLAAAQQQGLANAPRTTKDAERYMVDFLKQVYAHIKESIEMQIGKRHEPGGWGTMAVSFLFSVPTTWTNQGIINAFKSVIREAGFGTESPRHRAEVDLTEAEAAAVETLKSTAISFNPGGLFMVVDAGGGTTDLALMRIKSTDYNHPEMSSMAAVRGIGVGASLIDRAFARMVASRLVAFPDVQSQLPHDFAARMSRSHQYKTTKHKFGERAYTQAVYRMPMEGVSHEFSHPGLGVENGRMLFSHAEIQTLFDTQLDGMMARIREQLDWLPDNKRIEKVDHMILSGGLGSSAYVRESLQQRLKFLQHPNASNVVVVPCQDPQLVVVRGLLNDQKQKMETGNKPVLGERIARASYGVVVRQPYSPTYHMGADLIEDKFDPTIKYAINQIQWLIRKGDVIQSGSSIPKSCEVRFSVGDVIRTFDAEFVVSQNEASSLPRSLKHAGATKLCKVKNNLATIPTDQLTLKTKRGGCCGWSKTQFYLCNFDVRVVVAPADLRFELWFNGQKFSGSHDAIQITWDPVGEKSASK